MFRLFLLFSFALVGFISVFADEPEPGGRKMPDPVSRTVDFAKDIKPILDRSCTKCHANGKRKGGFSIDHIHSFIGGGESGPAFVTGMSAESLLIELVLSDDPDERMPSKGEPLTLDEIATLRAWIDQGLQWEKGFTFAEFRNAPVEPRVVALPRGPEANPVDRLLAPYLEERETGSDAIVSDTIYARRVFLDSIGLLPTPAELETFRADRRPDKRARLVADLLADTNNYAEHWITFWSDCLRNSMSRSYHGEGRGGKQITAWLKTALAENKPYDQFVRELIDPVEESSGFIKGIAWRGTVNASQVTEMQAAQNVSQVFLGLNIKCASCHDSFINHWTLKQTYSLASVFADQPMDVFRCDKPIGEKAAPAFLYPELGTIDPSAPRPDRVKQLAEIMTSPNNGRLARTVVNRLWAIFFGRGLVEPVDEMDNPAWNEDLLDWLAIDLVHNGYDLKRTMRLLLTSRAYQRPAVALDPDAEEYIFRGPVVRRMSAEQFFDSLDQVILAAGGGAQVREEHVPDQFDRNTALYDSGVVTGGAKEIDIDISNQDILVLVVDEGKRGTSWDHANWGVPVLHGSDGKRVKLTDLPWLVATSGWGKVEKDNAVVGTSLRIASTTYSFGLGTHAHSLIAFDISGKGFTRFTASVGADRSATDDPEGWADLEFLVYGITADSGRGTGQKRAGLRKIDHLMRTLGRTKRDVVVTRRESVATTAQLIELSNGKPVAELMKRGGRAWLESGLASEAIVEALFANAIGRGPSAQEKQSAAGIVGVPAAAQGIEDLLWMLAMHPEFQLIH